MLVRAYLIAGAVSMVLGCNGKKMSQATCKHEKCGPTGQPDLEGVGMLQKGKVRNKIDGFSETGKNMILQEETTDDRQLPDYKKDPKKNPKKNPYLNADDVKVKVAGNRVCPPAAKKRCERRGMKCNVWGAGYACVW